MARKARKVGLTIPTPARKRSSYAVRSGACTRVAQIAAKAITEKPVFVEDEDGHRIRQWKPEGLQRFTNSDIERALRGVRALDEEDMLEFIPPSAIKYCVTEGWLVKATGGFYLVTRKAAAELDLPRKDAGGRTIAFADRGL